MLFVELDPCRCQTPRLYVHGSRHAQFWLASNVDGNIKQNAVRKNVDLKRRLLYDRSMRLGHSRA